MEFTFESAISVLWNQVKKRKAWGINIYRIDNEEVITLIKRNKIIPFIKSSKDFYKRIKKYC